MVVKELGKDQNGIITDFETAKHKYRVIMPGKPLGIVRFTAYESMKIVFGTGNTFEGLMSALERLEKTLGGDQPFAEIRVDSILLVNSLRRGVLDMSKARFNQALYLASVFIYREGDDPNEWNFETATDYISDWAENGLSEQDFFFFAATVTSGFLQFYRKARAANIAEMERLSGFGGATGQSDNL